MSWSGAWPDRCRSSRWIRSVIRCSYLILRDGPYGPPQDEDFFPPHPEVAAVRRPRRVRPTSTVPVIAVAFLGTRPAQSRQQLRYQHRVRPRTSSFETGLAVLLGDEDFLFLPYPEVAAVRRSRRVRPTPTVPVIAVAFRGARPGRCRTAPASPAPHRGRLYFWPQARPRAVVPERAPAARASTGATPP